MWRHYRGNGGVSRTDVTLTTCRSNTGDELQSASPRQTAPAIAPPSLPVGPRVQRRSPLSPRESARGTFNSSASTGRVGWVSRGRWWARGSTVLGDRGRGPAAPVLGVGRAAPAATCDVRHALPRLVPFPLSEPDVRLSRIRLPTTVTHAKPGFRLTTRPGLARE